MKVVKAHLPTYPTAKRGLAWAWNI